MRNWWLRTLLVLQAPRPVFVALRDDSKESASDRSEPVLTVVVLAGIAYALSTPTAAHLMDDGNFDGLVTAVWAFIVGGIYGGAGYFALGAALHRSVKALGSRGSYRRTRHVLAFAAIPLVLSLVLWPLKLGLWGGDVFRTGGSDSATGEAAFAALELAFLVWTLALLVVGVRAVHGWTWARALAAVVLTASAAVGVVAVVYALHSYLG